MPKLHPSEIGFAPSAPTRRGLSIAGPRTAVPSPRHVPRLQPTLECLRSPASDNRLRPPHAWLRGRDRAKPAPTKTTPGSAPRRSAGRPVSLPSPRIVGAFPRCVSLSWVSFSVSLSGDVERRANRDVIRGESCSRADGDRLGQHELGGRVHLPFRGRSVQHMVDGETCRPSERRRRYGGVSVEQGRFLNQPSKHLL